jgi:hypothetical protein
MITRMIIGASCQFLLERVDNYLLSITVNDSQTIPSHILGFL